METFYFGAPQPELFGAYWSPSRATNAARAVLIVNPLGQEYMRTHRALNQLAALLSGAGCHVMRFDYFGCGDSLGDGEDVSLARCRDDIATAAAELREIAGCDELTLLGARLGANLAVGARGAGGAGPCVLWDPVADGRTLVATLRAMERRMHHDLHRFARPRTPRAATPERLLGHAYSPALLDEISRLDLGAVEVDADGPPIYLLSAPSHRDCRAYQRFRRRAGARLILIDTDEAYWDELSTIEVALLPVPAFRRIAWELAR